MAAEIRLSRKYVEWAHGPAADDGHAPSLAICLEADQQPGPRVRITVTRETAAELRSVASLWADRVGLDPESVPVGFSRTARRVLAEVPDGR